MNRIEQIETLAIWLTGAAVELNLWKKFRKLIQEAQSQARELYEDVSKPDEFTDELGVRTVLADFAAAVDEDYMTRTREGN